ncbi:unnamed protein product [Penicillium palitans]
MASNTTLPNCSPIQFPEPPKYPNQWVTPLISGVCGLVGLGMVLWFLVWVIRLNARQALLNHPQRVMSNQYLQRQEMEEKRQTPWWHLWPNKAHKAGSVAPLQPNATEPESSKTGEERDAKEPKQEEEKPAPPRLTILCDASVESPNVPLSQKTDSELIPLEYVAPPQGLSLASQPKDIDALSGILDALKGKGKGKG